MTAAHEGYTENLQFVPLITAPTAESCADERHHILQTNGYSNWIEGYKNNVNPLNPMQFQGILPSHIIIHSLIHFSV